MPPMPPRLTIIGDIERPDHYHLPDDATCYFWGEYTPWHQTGGLKWDFSPTNQLVSNFKKKMDRQGKPDWQYKQQAIQKVARSFAHFWRWHDVHQQYHPILVPVPPSRPRGDGAYDSRMVDMLNAMAAEVGIQLDIRDCLSFSGQYAASHDSETRPTPVDLYEDLEFDEAVGQPHNPPGVIFLFDDLLTTGAHYRAASEKLNDYLPGVKVVGNFIARRIVPNPFANLSDFDDSI